MHRVRDAPIARIDAPPKTVTHNPHHRVRLRESKLRIALLVIAVLLCACAPSQEGLTARATSCSSRDVKILKSQFERQGVTTAWCASCEGKMYQCASNADRTQVQCRAIKEDEMCR